MNDVQFQAGGTEVPGTEGPAVVSQQLVDGHAEARVVRHGIAQELDGTGRLFVGVHGREAQARVVIDGHEEELPARIAPIAPVASDAVSDLLDAAELLGVDVDHVARCRMFVAHHRLDRHEIAQQRQTGACQDTTDRALGNPQGASNEGVRSILMP